MCIAMIAKNHMRRVFRNQMNIGYPISSAQTPMPRTGRSGAKEASTETGIVLYGGDVNEHQMLVPFHHPNPIDFAKPLKK